MKAPHIICLVVSSMSLMAPMALGVEDNNQEIPEIIFWKVKKWEN